MFEFQMDVKESESVNIQKAKELGIYQVADARYYNPKFRVDEFSPKNMDEALEYANKAFYFYPLYVWIDGKKLDPTKVENKYIKVFKL